MPLLMASVLYLLMELLRVCFRLLIPGGLRKVASEYLLMKHQLCVISQKRRRAPNLDATDRFIFGFLALWVHPRRLLRSAVVISPGTLLRFHRAMVKRKYRKLFTPSSRRKPGPKGPCAQLIKLVIDIKVKNPRYGCERIAFLVSELLGEKVDDQTVRRILRRHWNL